MVYTNLVKCKTPEFVHNPEGTSSGRASGRAVRQRATGSAGGTTLARRGGPRTERVRRGGSACRRLSKKRNRLAMADVSSCTPDTAGAAAGAAEPLWKESRAVSGARRRGTGSGLKPTADPARNWAGRNLRCDRLVLYGLFWMLVFGIDNDNYHEYYHLLPLRMHKVPGHRPRTHIHKYVPLLMFPSPRNNAYACYHVQA